MKYLAAFWILVLCSLSGTIVGQTWQYTDFSSTSGLVMNGATAQVGASLHLTAPNINSAGSVWRSNRERIVDGFETTFSFRLTDVGGSADGIAFVIHNDPSGTAALGSPGEGMGYGVGRNSNQSITNSLAIEIDTYQNNFAMTPDLGPSEISIHSLGAGGNNPDEAFSIGRALAPYSLADGQVHTLRVVYAPRKAYEMSSKPLLSVYLDGAGAPIVTADYGMSGGLHGQGEYLGGGQVVGIPTVNGEAYVGITGATGGQISRHEILSWSWNQNRTWHVDNSGSLSGNGTQATPFGSIGAAVLAAIDGDTIRILPGVYAEAIEPLGKSLRFEGTTLAGATEVTGVLEAAGNENLILDGLSLGSVVFGTPFSTVGFEFRNCKLGNVSLTTIFSGRFERCFIDEVAMWESDVSLERCIVADRFECIGGGNGGVTAGNCLFRGHTISVAYDSYAWLTNCTVSATLGQGLFIDGSANLRRCIVWGDVPPQFNSNSITINDSDIQGGWSGLGVGNINVDPMYVDVANKDWHLAPGSPCIDATSATTVPEGALDFDGEPRRIGSFVDMGADESTYSFDLVGSTLGNGVGNLTLGVANIPAGATHVILIASHTPAPGGIGTGPLLGLVPDPILSIFLNHAAAPADLFHFPVSHNPYANGPLSFGPGTMAPYVGQVAEVTAIAYSIPFTGILGQTNFVSLAY